MTRKHTPKARPTALLVCCSLFMTHCSYFGYYKYEQAVRVPTALSEPVRFPDSYDGSVRTEGAATRALAVAMNDFLPPGRSLKGENPPVARCLSRWETYDISILRATDDLFFIQFSPILARCGLDDSTIMDAGAEYAVDGQGRILAVH
ncbi:hypothetical protein [Hyalangium minutum]|uniref:hypothetical protein n=1 Tax=Hyalangium minutum TaxID=394096 RepID=UPI00094B5B1F|nr:hypothetical protein [Hyalangium minutum]